MVPALLLFSAGLLTGVALSAPRAEAPPRALPGSRGETTASEEEVALQLARVAEAQEKFLPHASVVAEEVAQSKGGGWLPWREAVSYLPGLTETTALYFAMEDDEAPLWVKAIMALAILYVVSPADVIPDELPGFGQVDDMAVLFFTFKSVAPWVRPEHYQKAEEWLVSHGIEPKPFIELGEWLDAEDWAARYEAERGKPVPQLPGPSL